MRECPRCLRCFSNEVSHCPVEGHATINSLPGDPVLDGRYLLERRLGQGGMGVVYKAHHVFLKMPHAIKVIMPDLVGNDPSVAARFRQEAMAAAAIRHPNIISVTDYGFIAGGIPFLVMEFLEGNSLQEVMSDQGKFSPEQALEYIRAIAAGVGAAHRQKIIHRDLKPLNIMIRSGQALSDGLKVLDFGLAKIKSGELSGTFVGAKTAGIIGSPYYMAPEQWSDEELDKRCDIYSLGIILHQMLTGDVPFKGSSVPAVMRKHLMTPPPPLATARGGISEALERVVHHALEKEPQARTATVEDLVAELEEAVNAVVVISGVPAIGRGNTAKLKSAVLRSEPDVSTLVSPEPEKPGPGAARITAEFKRAQLEEEAIARHTADQEEVRIKSLDTEASFAAETTVGLTQEELSDEVGQPAYRQEAKDEKTGDRSSIDQTLEVAASRTWEKVTDSLRTIEVKARDLRPEAQELWQSATVKARRGGEERAPHEAENPGVGLLPTARLPSPAPQAAVWAQFSQPTAPNTQISVRRSIRKPLVAAGIVVALIISAVGVYFLSSDSNKPVGGRDTALISGGMFMMGTNFGTDEQKPAHLVNVRMFYMDKTEVTNLEYSAFVKETGRLGPANDDTAENTKGYWTPWNGNEPPAGRERFPVCNVTVKDAEDFAQWLSKRDGVRYRLPTEEEWEYAARNGSLNTLFPWGNSWVEGRANINGESSPRDVGSYPEGATRAGLLDMIGNVWEWTASKGSYYDPSKEAVEERSANRAANIRRGGSFASKVGSNFSDATDRTWNNKDPDYKHPGIGFRLVRDAP